MAKGKNVRVDGKKKAQAPPAKDLEPRKAQAIAGGRGSVYVSDIVITKEMDKSSN